MAESSRLSKSADTYFMEDDQAYARFLWLRADGSYRQINRDRTSAQEVDRGSWDQTINGEVSLHPTNGMLTFRAVSAGSLMVLLDTQSRIDSLPALQDRIITFLQSYEDMVFARTALVEINATLNVVNNSVDDAVASISLALESDTFDRNDLQELLRKLQLWLKSKTTNTFMFDLVSASPIVPVLVQRGAVFTSDLLSRVRAAHHLKPTEASPFYFSRISRKAFFAQTGAWKPFENLGGLHAESTVQTPAR